MFGNVTRVEVIKAKRNNDVSGSTTSSNGEWILESIRGLLMNCDWTQYGSNNTFEKYIKYEKLHKCFIKIISLPLYRQMLLCYVFACCVNAAVDMTTRRLDRRFELWLRSCNLNNYFLRLFPSHRFLQHSGTRWPRRRIQLQIFVHTRSAYHPPYCYVVVE